MKLCWLIAMEVYFVAGFLIGKIVNKKTELEVCNGALGTDKAKLVMREMKYLFINTVAGSGSTGKIAADKCRELQKQRHQCTLAYDGCFCESDI